MFCLWVNAPGTAQYSFTSILRAYWSCFDRDNVSHKLTTTRYKPLNKYKQLVPVHATNKQPPTAKPPHKETFCQKKEETERNKRKSINPTHVEHEHRTYRILLARYFILANHDNHLCVVLKITVNMSRLLDLWETPLLHNKLLLLPGTTVVVTAEVLVYLAK